MKTRWHIIEGESGCAYARKHAAIAVVVDALRASTTAAMLFDAGATEILAVREVEDAFRAKAARPESLLFGERGGVPPEGFDYGNSPREVEVAEGRPVIFTTSNGSARLIQAWGAAEVYLASTVNALALVRAVARHARDVVLIPASTTGDPNEDIQEDWVAATAIAMLSDAAIGEGAHAFRYWRQLIELDGVARLFQAAPHAPELAAIGLEADVAFCARSNITDALPRAAERNAFGVLLRNGAP